MTDRLAEIEQRNTGNAGYVGFSPNPIGYSDVEWLIGEVKRLRKIEQGLNAENGRLLETNGDLRQRIGYAHAALTYVGPLNDYEYLALYELGVSGDCPETMDMGRIHKLLEEEPWQ